MRAFAIWDGQFPTGLFIRIIRKPKKQTNKTPPFPPMLRVSCFLHRRQVRRSGLGADVRGSTLGSIT